MKLRYAVPALALALGFGAPVALAQTPAATGSANHPGKAVYDKACAMCHNNPGQTRAATLEGLRAMSPETIRMALAPEGKMAAMAAALSQNEVTELVGWLTADQKAAPASWEDTIMCAADKRSVSTAGFVSQGFGVDAKLTRNLSAKQAGLKKSQLANLEVAWAIGVPRSAGTGAGAAFIGDTAFINLGGRLTALDAAEGCIKWKHEIQSRNTPTIADINGKKALVFAAGGANIVAVDAVTGEEMWKGDGLPSNGIGAVRGGVVVHRDKVIVPISASGVAAAGNPKFECCVGHGAVIALSAKDGSRLWEYNTMKDAEYTGQVSSTGVKQRGPSGAPIWSIPTIDAKRNRVIVTTGENTSYPGTDTSDAVIALDLDTGKVAWQFQAMESDVWNMACGPSTEKSGPNCPWHFDENAPGRDFDFGAGAIITKGKGGKDVVLAGQKSGHVWALDADTGEVVWSDRIGEGSPLGGVHWGIATDGKRLIVPIADSIPMGPKPVPGVYAYDIKTGKQVWSYEAKPDCDGERGKLISACAAKYGFSAAPTVVDGAVLAATLDGKLFAFDSKTGKVLNEIDLAGPRPTINGVEGKGGSIEAHGLAVGDGVILINSGYGLFGQTPGNLLIALKPAPK
ncbi:MAG: PQQ-binding-like beta-propeller repeat protein [Hyphomonadaceae bacterium]